MFNNLLGRFSRDMGIDLGTANTLVYVRDKGIVINEPSIVAINTRADQILAVGENARKMLGKTPPHIITSRPLSDGVISDFEIAERMLKHFIAKVHQDKFSFYTRPRVIIGIPLEITEVERKAVEDAAMQAGAREVFLVEEPMAAAIGARLPIQESCGNMIVDIGGGTTEIAVISLAGIVTWKSLPIAGNELTEDIIEYAREKYNLLIGETTAEEIKIKIGSVFPLEKSLKTIMRGRDLVSGLPKEETITDEEVREAMQRSAKILAVNIRDTIESTPPELVADIYSRGIVLSGGGALLKGLQDLIYREVQVPIHITDDPLTAVVRGLGIIIEDMNTLKDVLLPSAGEIT
ncbi:rod shape-determining protein [Patescibacteria group bacterium]|nr:rod shape-determining protein [Patescibacteria group bacterium]MBU4512895.1 rod shape-determining protein [Patescibacteria group bacterium]MCG2692615.1 rod shape-determining protein [Candidatus Parcubacteria bacterium]